MNMESRGVSIGEKKHTKLNFWNETQRYHVRCRLRREIMIVRNWRRIYVTYRSCIHAMYGYLILFGVDNGERKKSRIN